MPCKYPHCTRNKNGVEITGDLLKHKIMNIYFLIGLRFHSSLSSSLTWWPIGGRISDFGREKPFRLAPNLACLNIGRLLSSTESTMVAFRPCLRLQSARTACWNWVCMASLRFASYPSLLSFFSYGVVDRIAAVPVDGPAPASIPARVVPAKSRMPSFDNDLFVYSRP